MGQQLIPTILVASFNPEGLRRDLQLSKSEEYFANLHQKETNTHEVPERPNWIPKVPVYAADLRMDQPEHSQQKMNFIIMCVSFDTN